MNELIKDDFYKSIKVVLEAVRSNVYRTVNFAMVQAYWNVGRLIVEEEQRGKQRAEYGKGFNERNLWYIRNFYIIFPKVNALRAELTWTHYRLLLKVENEQARKFYLNGAAESNWSTRQLERQINSFYYERLL
jgi:hypothetical protein